MAQPGVSVVIVDHHDATRSVLRQVFEEQWSWSVIGEVSTGTDAVVLARTTRPDVIVADAGITDMSVDELSRLVGPPSGPSVVVALLDFPHQYAAGPDSSVIKGVPMDHLKNVVMRTLRQAHPEDPRWRDHAEPEAIYLPGPPAPEPAGESAQWGPPSSHLSGERVYVDLHDGAPPQRRRRQRVGLLGSLLGDELDETDDRQGSGRVPAHAGADGWLEVPVMEAPVMGAPALAPPALEVEQPDATESLGGAPVATGASDTSDTEWASDLVIIGQPLSPTQPEARGASSGLFVLDAAEPAGRAAAMAELLDGPVDADSLARAAAAATDPVVGVRELAMQVFEQAPDRVAPSLIEPFLVDPHAPLRARAARLLAASGRPAAVGSLLGRLETESDPAVRVELVGAVAAVAGIPGAPAFEAASVLSVVRAVGGMPADALAEHHSELRSLATVLGTPAIIGHLGDLDATAAHGAEVLIDASSVRQDGGTPTVEMASGAAPAPVDAASGGEQSRAGPVQPAIGETVDDQLLPTLIDALDDPDDQVRQGAEAALRTVDPRRVLIWLTSRLSVGDQSAIALLERARKIVDLTAETAAFARVLVGLPYGAAKEGLGRILSELPTVRPLVDEWLGSPEAPLRLMALELAGHTHQLSDPALQQAVLDAVVGDTSAEVALAAAVALGEAPPGIRSHAVTAALAHPDRRVRMAGVALIPRDGDMTSLAVDLVLDHDPEVARAAAAALIEFPTSEVIALAWASLRSALACVLPFRRQSLTRVSLPIPNGRLIQTSRDGSTVTHR